MRRAVMHKYYFQSCGMIARLLTKTYRIMMLPTVSLDLLYEFSFSELKENVLWKISETTDTAAMKLNGDKTIAPCQKGAPFDWVARIGNDLLTPKIDSSIDVRIV